MTEKLDKYFNKKWSEYGHELEIRTYETFDEAGQHSGFGLHGTVDGKSKRGTGALVADSSHYQDLKHTLDLYAHGFTAKEIWG